MVISGSAKDEKSVSELLNSLLIISDFKVTKNFETNGIVIDSYIDPKTN
jgi:hypothetical protein